MSFIRLAAEQPDALRDFWTVYAVSQEAMREAALKVVRGHPVFGPMVATMSQEDMDRQNQESIALLRRAIEDDAWEPYVESLRTQGTMYARMKIPFSSWYEITRVVQRVLVPRLIAAYGKKPERLARAMSAMMEFIDHGMALMADRYVTDTEGDAAMAERKVAEDKLRASEESLSTALHSIGDGVIATDTTGNVVRMNPVAERLTGWTIDGARGRPFTEVFDIVNEVTGARAVNPIERVLREGVIVGLANHTALIAKDGTKRPIADSAAPIAERLSPRPAGRNESTAVECNRLSMLIAIDRVEQRNASREMREVGRDRRAVEEHVRHRRLDEAKLR
jgi:PAS domain S-box-containing protein